MEYLIVLKNSLGNSPIVGLPKRGGRYMVYKDVSEYDLGVVLLQEM